MNASPCTHAAGTLAHPCVNTQYPILQANYGKGEPAAVAAVKAVYRELDLEGVFKQ